SARGGPERTRVGRARRTRTRRAGHRRRDPDRARSRQCALVPECRVARAAGHRVCGQGAGGRAARERVPRPRRGRRGVGRAPPRASTRAPAWRPRLLERGHLVLTGGTTGDWLTLTPPAVVTTEQLAHFESTLRDVLAEARA